MEHDSQTSKIYKENWDDAVILLNAQDARIAKLEGALREILGVAVATPNQSICTVPRAALGTARQALGL